MRGRVIGALHRRSVRGDLFESGGKPVGIAREERTRGIGKEFALSGNGKLNELCRYGRDDYGNNAGNEKYGALAVAIPSPIKTHAKENVRKHRYHSGENHSDSHNKNVAVANVREFVREHSLKLAPFERL